MALKVTKVEKPTIEETPCEWVDYQDGVKFKIYGISHPLYNLAINKFEQRDAKEDLLNLNEHSQSFYTQIGIVGRYLVADWEGVLGEDKEGNEVELELTIENFESLILNFPDLLGWIFNQACLVQENYYKELITLKKKPSSGTSGRRKPQK